MFLSIVQSLLPDLENMKKTKTLLAKLWEKRPQGLTICYFCSRTEYNW